jgi:hypothetical protein
MASYAILEDMCILHNDSDFMQIARESKLKPEFFKKLSLHT